MFLDNLHLHAVQSAETCSFGNETAVYSNLSALHGCDCIAPFPADSAIAGPGIIACFCFLSFLTIAVAAIPATHSLRQAWKTTSKPRRLWSFVVEVLQLRSSTSSPTRPAQEPVENVNVAARCSSTSFGSQPAQPSTSSPDSKPGDAKPPGDDVARTSLVDQWATEPPSVAIAKSALVALTDVQIASGLACITFGLVNIRRISFYHEQVVINLWWLTVNSLWVSRIDFTHYETEDCSASSGTIPTISSLRFLIRHLAVIASVVVSAVFQAIVAVREHAHWSAIIAGKCYVGSALGGSGYGDNIFWLVGTALYGLALVAGLSPRLQRWLEERVFDRIDNIFEVIWAKLKRLSEVDKVYNGDGVEPSVLRPKPFFVKACRAVKFISCCLLLLIWWCAIQFLTVWSSGVGSYIVEMIAYSAFAITSAVWVIYLKVENKALVIGDEDRWDFAQALMVGLCLLVLICVLDRIHDVRNKRVARLNDDSTVYRKHPA